MAFLTESEKKKFENLNFVDSKYLGSLKSTKQDEETALDIFDLAVL